MAGSAAHSTRRGAAAHLARHAQRAVALRAVRQHHGAVAGAQLGQRHVAADAHVAEEGDAGVLRQGRELVDHVLRAGRQGQGRRSSATAQPQVGSLQARRRAGCRPSRPAAALRQPPQTPSTPLCRRGLAPRRSARGQRAWAAPPAGGEPRGEEAEAAGGDRTGGIRQFRQPAQERFVAPSAPTTMSTRAPSPNFLSSCSEAGQGGQDAAVGRSAPSRASDASSVRLLDCRAALQALPACAQAQGLTLSAV